MTNFYKLKIILLFLSLSTLFDTACCFKFNPQTVISGVTYSDRCDTFKNTYQISFSKDGYNCTFKNISDKTIYINITLSAFSSDEVISLSNGMDLSYRMSTVLTPISKDSTVNFDCHEFAEKTNKAQNIELFWIYDLPKCSKNFSKLKKLYDGKYEIMPKDFKKVKGMMFLEIDRINFCEESKYKVTYEKY